MRGQRSCAGKRSFDDLPLAVIVEESVGAEVPIVAARMNEYGARLPTKAEGVYVPQQVGRAAASKTLTRCGHAWLVFGTWPDRGRAAQPEGAARTVAVRLVSDCRSFPVAAFRRSASLCNTYT